MEKIRLEECCVILDSMRVPITAKDRKKGPYPYYGANGVQDYVADYIFDDELVLLAEDGGNFGSEVKPIAYKISGKCWVNNHAHVLKPKEGIDVDYLCYSLMFYKVDGMVNGATRKKLTQAAMREMLIPLRRIEKQKEIVGILNKVQTLIQKEREQIELYDKLVKARFVEMFGDPIINEKRWKRVVMGDICEIGSSKRIFEKEYVASGVPFYRTKEIVELSRGCEISTELYITRERFEELKEKYGVPVENDLLISAVGTIGIIWVVDGKQDFYFKDGNLIKIDASTAFDSLYMKYLLEKLIENYKNKMSTGTAYSALTISGLKEMLAYDVPISLQKRFAAFAQQVEKLKSTTKILFNLNISKCIWTFVLSCYLLK